MPTANDIKCVNSALAFVKKLAFSFTQDFLVTEVCIFILLRIKSLVRIPIILRFVSLDKNIVIDYVSALIHLKLQAVEKYIRRIQLEVNRETSKIVEN